MTLEAHETYPKTKIGADQEIQAIKQQTDKEAIIKDKEWCQRRKKRSALMKETAQQEENHRHTGSPEMTKDGVTQTQRMTKTLQPENAGWDVAGA